MISIFPRVWFSRLDDLMINVLVSSQEYSGVNPGSDEENTIKLTFATPPFRSEQQ